MKYQSGPKKGKFIGKAWIKEKDKTIIFPSGAKSSFSYMQYDKDADAWYGSEITKIYFDEFQRFTDYQFQVLRSRNRSKAAVQKGIRCTLNPDANHFVYDWVEPYLDEDGFPDPEFAARTRYFLIVDGELVSDWDAQVLRDKYGKEPQTYSYIPATLEDNKVLLDQDPEYKDVLDSLPEKKRKQLLLGCWQVDSDNGIYWKSEWLHKADGVPAGRTVRGYDLAATEPSEGVYPDYSASVKMTKTSEGYYYLWGDYIEDFADPNTAVRGRMRKRSGDRDKIMLKQAFHDGDDVRLVIPQDAGASGKDAFIQKCQYFAKHGFMVKKAVGGANASKLAKFEGFATACENGLVYVVESTFNQATLEALYKELQSFDNTRSTSRRKDDWVDACAEAFNELARERVIESFSIGNNAPQTKIKRELGGFLPSNNL